MFATVLPLLFCLCFHAGGAARIEAKFGRHRLYEEKGNMELEIDKGRAAKTITYIRHGKSAGNDRYGMFEKRSLAWYKDGQLVKEGVQQAIDRVADLDSKLVNRIANADLVLISPLQRAMATALLVVGEAIGRVGAVRLPKVLVMKELNEKMKSDSEMPGSGTNPMAYLQEVAARYGNVRQGGELVMKPMLDDINKSYQAARIMKSKLYPSTDAYMYIDQIQRFKQKLQSRVESNILIVAHSGWARFAFAEWLPSASEVEDFNENAIHGVRRIRPLANCGVISAKFEKGRFVDVDLAGANKHPNDLNKSSPGVLISVADAKAAGKVPANAQFDRIVVPYSNHCSIKPRGKFDFGRMPGFLIFSFVNGEAWISCFKRWGEMGKKVVQLHAGTKATRDDNGALVIGELKMKMKTETDYADLKNLLEKYLGLLSQSA